MHRTGPIINHAMLFMIKIRYVLKLYALLQLFTIDNDLSNIPANFQPFKSHQINIMTFYFHEVVIRGRIM